MYPHVTQFETRTMQIHNEIRVRAEREALRRPTRTPGSHGAAAPDPLQAALCRSGGSHVRSSMAVSTWMKSY